MKYLNLEATHRTYLTGKGALGFDDEGNEVLVGLSLAETTTYLEMAEETASGRTSDDLDELERFLELVNRHEAALPASSIAVVVEERDINEIVDRSSSSSSAA